MFFLLNKENVQIHLINEIIKNIFENINKKIIIC